MIVKLAAVAIQSSYRYPVPLHPHAKVGEMARYLSHYEAYVSTRTLEIALPAAPEHRLRDLDWRPGDRLAIFTQAPRLSQLPVPVQRGDRVIKFSLGDFVLDLRGKKSILVGRRDDAHGMIPDVDLRYFISPGWLESLPRACLWLDYDSSSRVWYASRIGQLPLTINDFEIREERLPLNESQWMRIFQPGLSPAESRPIGEVCITVEEAQQGDTVDDLAGGGALVDVCIGTEYPRQTLKISGGLRIGQLMRSVAEYHRLPIDEEGGVYLLRLVSPETKIEALHFGADEFLYAGWNLPYGESLLLLRDVHSEVVYRLAAGREDEEKRVGCRPPGSSADSALDIDLYDSFSSQGRAARFQMTILYQAAEQSWWLRPSDKGRVPVFINNARIHPGESVQFLSGDVLSIGPSVTDYYARFEVEISAGD